jgi:DNA-binding transcriptional LysR family regulator
LLLEFNFQLKINHPLALKHRLSQVRIRQLRMLVWLADGLTLSAAAQQLHITAAAASQMLLELESSVGARLFDRDRRGARATESGRLLAQRAAVMLHEFELFEDSVHKLGQQPLLLRLGVIPQVMIERVPDIAARVNHSYPGSLQVTEGTSQALVDDVREGRLAAAITRMGAAGVSMRAMQGLKVEPLGTEQAAIAISKAHSFARKRLITPDALKTLGWVLPESGSYIRNTLEQYFQTAQLGAPQCMLQVSTTVHALWCASQMQLAAAGPLSLIHRFSTEWQLKVLPVSLGEPIQICLCYRPSQLELPSFKVLREAILHRR